MRRRFASPCDLIAANRRRKDAAMKKLLWHSNTPWAPTGYGCQTKLVTPRLAEHYDLAISSFYGLEGDRLEWEGIPVFPGLGGEFGNDYIVKNAMSHFGSARGGIVLTLLDVWVLEPETMRQLDTAAWVPVDHSPAPPMVRRYFTESGAIPIAMARFGAEQLVDLDPLYVPHGVDTEVYKPLPKDESREMVGAEQDAFLVGMVAANKGAPSRKCFSQALQAFAAFRQTHDDAILYLHTNMNGDEDLFALKEAVGLPDEAVRIADQYRINLHPLPARIMARVYSTFDVLLNPSAGEGFGVPVLEAQACGVPAIVSNFSAMKEVCGSGWKVACTPRWTAQKAWQVDPSVEEIVDSLEQAYGLSEAERKQASELAVTHAAQYEVGRVIDEHFLPALAEVEARIAARKPMKLEAVA